MNKEVSYFAGLSVEQGSRSLALALLKKANKSSARLQTLEDSEALHDFRVALRRLRNCLKAYASYLPVDKKIEKKLRKIARQTNKTRDHEVMIQWLQNETKNFTPTHRIGLDWVLDHYKKKYELDLSKIQSRILPAWEKIETQLSRYLQQNKDTGKLQSHESFIQFSGNISNNYCQQLSERLALVSGIHNISEMHAARIAAKHLRYLLEPFADTVPESKDIVNELKTFQDLLGAFHDNSVFIEKLSSVVRRAAADHAYKLYLSAVSDNDEQTEALRKHGPIPGLLKLVKNVKSHRDEMFAEIQKRYLQNGIVPLTDRVMHLSSKLMELDTTNQ